MHAGPGHPGCPAWLRHDLERLARALAIARQCARDRGEQTFDRLASRYLQEIDRGDLAESLDELGVLLGDRGDSLRCKALRRELLGELLRCLGDLGVIGVTRVDEAALDVVVRGLVEEPTLAERRLSAELAQLPAHPFEDLDALLAVRQRVHRATQTDRSDRL